MNYVTLVLLAFSCGLMDRYRGNSINVFVSKPVESVIYGVFVGTLLGLELLPLILFSGLWAVGAAFGWGEPLGALMRNTKMDEKGLEWWQFWKLKESPMLACIFRGLLWGACILPVAYFSPLVAPLAILMGAIFPLAIRLATKKIRLVNEDDWGLQEYYRGWMVGIVALVLALV